MIIICVATLALLLENCVALQSEGDACSLSNINSSDPGKCISVHQCEHAKNLLREGKRPHTCGFKKHEPLVCCPESEELVTSGTKSLEMCYRYTDIRSQVFAIHNGEKALVKEFPHMAAVGYGNDNTSILWLCGGTIISHFFVLTAAHCLSSRDFGPAKWVRLGDLDLKNTTEEADPVDLSVVSSFAHPNYKSSSHYHDIALLKLGKEVNFGIYYKPACLHVESEVPDEKLQATGWGRLGYLGENSSHLMKVYLKVVNHGICASRYANVSPRKLEKGIVDEYQICAGDSAGGDTCPGDSGGPLHFLRNATEKQQRHYVVVGVTSFGKGCGGGNVMGVYTRVSSYLGWIEHIVWAEEI